MKKLILLILLVLWWAGSAGAADYYVDATAGDDTNAGISGATPWKTLYKVRTTAYNPGDNIYLKRGESWREGLIISSVTGTAVAPITFGVYGTGDKPQLLFDHNKIKYGGFEDLDSGTADDTDTDNFTSWAESGVSILSVSDSHLGGKAVKLVRVLAEPYLRATIPSGIFEAGTTYTISAWVKNGGSDAGRMRVTDVTNNLDLQSDGSWAAPNKYIFAATEAVYTQKSITFVPQVGITTLRMDVLGGADVGREYFVDSIWIGKGTSVQTGVGERDATNGMLQNLYVNDSAYITVQDLDCRGSKNDDLAATWVQYVGRIDGTSDNIKVHRCEFRYGDRTTGNICGLVAASTTSNVEFDGIIATENSNTGIYNSAQTGIVRNSQSYNNALESPSGDGGGIGCFRGSNQLWENNTVYNNGSLTGASDFELSVVESTGTFIIRKNNASQCVQGCIQVAEGTSTVLIEENLISGFGLAGTSRPTTQGHFAGIKIGGGGGGTIQGSIYNNVIANGGNEGDGNDSLGLVIGSRALDVVSGSSAYNNLFYNNACPDIYSHPDATIAGVGVDYNLYYKSDYTGNFVWDGATYDSIAAFRAGKSMEANGLAADPLMIDPDGTLTGTSNFNLHKRSPARDRGIEIPGMGSTDYYGRSRVQGQHPDIGAIEMPVAIERPPWAH